MTLNLDLSIAKEYYFIYFKKIKHTLVPNDINN